MRPNRIALVVAALAAAPLAAQQPVLMPANTYHSTLLSVAVYDPQVAIAVGSDGMILRTQDGGANWWRMYAGSNAELQDVTFNGVAVVAVGTGGTILRSPDGGVSWQLVFGGVSSQLKSVHFGDLTHGIIVGDSGVVLTTQDGGATWARQPSGVTEGFLDVRMSGPAAAVAVGANGLIARTDDGGRSWRRQASPTAQWLTGVWLTSPTTGTIVGLGGTGLYTTNGGATWLQGAMGASVGMSDVFQVDAATAVAAGSSATILRTGDGGRTWQQVFQGSGWAFEDVGFANPQVGWAVGSQGVVMRTTDGGLTWMHQMGFPAAPGVAASTPTLIPTGGSLYLEILGITIAAPAGPGMWRASVGTASNGNRLDQMSGTAPNGDVYMVSLAYTTTRTCPAFLASLISEGGQMQTAPAYIPPGWFQVSVEKDNVTAYVCLPMGNGNLIGGVTTPAIARVDPSTVRPALAAIGNAALLRWGYPRN